MNASAPPGTALLASVNRDLREASFETAFARAVAAFVQTRRSTFFHTAAQAAVRLDDVGKMEELLRAAAKTPTRALPADKIESVYLSRMQHLLPAAVQRRVTELASRPGLSVGELDALETGLLEPARRQAFIDARVLLVRARYEDEFRYARHFQHPFPYNYVTDYARNVPIPAVAGTGVKSVSLIYPIKNRSRRTAISLRSLAIALEALRRSDAPLTVDVVVVEDQGVDPLPDAEVQALPCDSTLRRVATGTTWSRSALLNEGLAIAKGQLVFFTDADVLFPETFLTDLHEALAAIDPARHLLAINMFETDTHQKNGKDHAVTTPYSHLWGVLRRHALAVGGFDDMYVGWGSEDRDFEHRVREHCRLTVLSSGELPGRPFVLHLSHDVRAGSESKEGNKARYDALRSDSSPRLVVTPTRQVVVLSSTRHRMTSRAADEVPLAFMEPVDRARATLILLTAGPATGSALADGTKRQVLEAFDTLAMDGAAPLCDEHHFRATYAGPTDPALVQRSAERPDAWHGTTSDVPRHPVDEALQAGYRAGYRRFVLLGAGSADESRKSSQPNWQVRAWSAARARAQLLVGRHDPELGDLDSVPLSLFGRAFHNVFLVMSCRRYAHRVAVLRPLYERGVGADDLVLFVEGGASSHTLWPDGRLELACGDGYEDLPQKVQAAIEFCAQHLEFERLIKVDDDVFVNFERLGEALRTAGAVDYLGRRNPSRPDIRPSADWHYGKVASDSHHEAAPFQIEPPPAVWASGGMYVLSRRATSWLAGPDARRLARYHLYEDFMVADILHRQGIHVVPWQDIAGPQPNDWLIPDLRHVFDDRLEQWRDAGRARRAVSVHCGPYPPYYGVSEERLGQLIGQLAAHTAAACAT